MEKDKLVHDLNAPINNLKMLILILEKSDLDKARVLEHLKKILNQSESNYEEIKKLIKN
jgi:hypothetical protein